MAPPRSSCTLTLDVRSYSEAKKLAKGRCITSDAFVAGGHSWRIRFYPNGSFAGTTSVSLCLDDAGSDDEVHAEFKFTMHEVGGGSPRFVTRSSTKTFSRTTEIGFLFRFISHEELDKSVFAEYDCFTIRCDLAILPADPSAATMAAAVAPPPARTLSGPGVRADLGRLLETEEGADVEFEVGGKTLAAHKLVLAARSSVFKADFFGARKEMTTSYVRVSGLNPEAFKGMLHYIYTDTLPEMPFSSGGQGPVLAEGLLQAAERYDLKDLKSLTEDKMCKHVSVSNALPMLVLAEQHQCRELKEKCLKFVMTYGNTRAAMETVDVEHLARTCPSVLKEVIAKVLDANETVFGAGVYVFICSVLLICSVLFFIFAVVILMFS